MHKIFRCIRTGDHDTPCNATSSEGYNCFAVSMFDECASPKTYAMQPFSCAFWQRHCESPTLARRFVPATCRGVMSRSESGLCGKHGNGACRSDNLRGTYSSKPSKAKILSEAYVVWRRVMVSRADAFQSVAGKKHLMYRMRSLSKITLLAYNRKLSFPPYWL